MGGGRGRTTWTLGEGEGEEGCCVCVLGGCGFKMFGLVERYCWVRKECGFRAGGIASEVNVIVRELKEQ